MTRTADLLTLTPAGLYCPLGNFHIDATRGVARNLVTHAHSDHARAGHDGVTATADTLAIMALRLGEGFCRRREPVRYGETRTIGDVRVTFHPAGHILGSAQIAIEKDGFRVVVSGDFKRRADPTCAPFEVVPCDAYVTEATFGLPVFHFPDPDAELARLLASRVMFPDRTHDADAGDRRLRSARLISSGDRAASRLLCRLWHRPWRHTPCGSHRPYVARRRDRHLHPRRAQERLGRTLP